MKARNKPINECLKQTSTTWTNRLMNDENSQIWILRIYRLMNTTKIVNCKQSLMD